MDKRGISKRGKGLGWLRQLYLTALCLVLPFGGSRLLTGSTPANSATPLAPTPPMGWNSWDGYGTTINEGQFRANTNWLAKHLRAFGWQYVVIDMEWFVKDPVPEGNSKTFQYNLDEFGRYIPDARRFPSGAKGNGFKHLAGFAHGLGLKF